MITNILCLLLADKGSEFITIHKIDTTEPHINESKEKLFDPNDRQQQKITMIT